jgi:hypothetical protein
LVSRISAVANFDLVLTYTEDVAAEFRNNGLPHPPVAAGNEMPSTNDLLWALESLDNADYDVPERGEGDLDVSDTQGRHRFRIGGFDWEDRRTTPGDSFVIYGRGPLSFALLIKLCERCGQLVLYPDSGDPAVVFDAEWDVQAVYELYCEAVREEDSWRFFFEQAYGPD